MLDHEPDGRRDVKALDRRMESPNALVYRTRIVLCATCHLQPRSSTQPKMILHVLCLPQFGVFRPGLVNDWQVGVGIFPDRENILVGSLGLAVLPEWASILPSCRRAMTPMGSAKTMPG